MIPKKPGAQPSAQEVLSFLMFRIGLLGLDFYHEQIIKTTLSLQVGWPRDLQGGSSQSAGLQVSQVARVLSI